MLSGVLYKYLLRIKIDIIYILSIIKWTIKISFSESFKSNLQVISHNKKKNLCTCMGNNLVELLHIIQVHILIIQSNSLKMGNNS